MKVSERLLVVDKIASELRGRYDFHQAAVFIRAFYPEAHTYIPDYESVREMASSNLSNVRESVLGEMVDDLGIESAAHIAAAVQRPANWIGDTPIRAFISHISVEKQKATRLREALKVYGISGFVAHEDISPTLEWQVQIERALHNMELFISLHTPKYSESFWAQQEIGFAVARGTKVIALRMGEDPKGFISKHQAISRGAKKAEDIAKEIDALLLADERTRERYAVAKFAADDDDVPF